MSTRTLILATRRSALALAQSRAFADRLRAQWPELSVDELQVVTTGDKITDRPLDAIGGKGLFTKEIEEALLARQAQLAVHSFKDVPAELSPAFVMACVPARADARDVLVAPASGPPLTLDTLPNGATVGTSSLRRAVQLRAARPDLSIVPLRGNVDTRLRKLDQGDMDAIVLAMAGLGRLGLSARASFVIAPETMIPAPGQGALAVECLADDDETRAWLAPLSDPETEIAVACERGAMSAVGGSCKVPFGAHARRVGDGISLAAFLANADGEGLARALRRAPWPKNVEGADAIGRDAGAELLAKLAGRPAQ
jgi:hydroxymethylbilane synthase